MKLSPKTDDYLIHCTLIEVDLATLPSYDALSYRWGTSITPERTIICNNTAFGVHKNLYNGLAQLQDLGWTSQPIWIDAISIDQGNNTEKSAQVNMMANIYRGASRVVVWLGQSSLATEVAVKKAQPLLGTSSEYVRSGSGTRLKTAALSWVLSRDWFTRVWTLQEVVLARETTYLLGERVLAFNQLLDLDFKNFPKNIDGMYAHLRARVDGLHFVSAAHSLLDAGEACTLETAVTEARNRQAKDGRDKVFGVLSLCQGRGFNEAEGLVADYSDNKTVQEVYCECAAALLRSKNTGIFLLSLVGQARHDCMLEYMFPSSFIEFFKPEKGFVTDIPSWVPDLSAPARPIPLRHLSTIEFSAASSLNPSFCITGDDSRGLVVKAAVLDVITATGDSHSVRLYQPIWHLFEVLFKLPDSHRESVYPPTGEPILTAFWRTLVAGETNSLPENAQQQCIELTDAHFAEWFAAFAEEGYWLSMKQMRTAILQSLDDDDLDLTAEPDHRRWDLWDNITQLQDSKTLDRYKIQAIRTFLTSFDSPAYSLRETIRRRDQRLQLVKQIREILNAGEQGIPEEKVFGTLFEKMYTGRRIFATKKGYMGTAPWTVIEGDVVMLVAGAYVPYVFRPSAQKKGSFELIGEAYCHGFMFGTGLETKGVDFDIIEVI